MLASTTLPGTTARSAVVASNVSPARNCEVRVCQSRMETSLATFEATTPIGPWDIA